MRKTTLATILFLLSFIAFALSTAAQVTPRFLGRFATDPATCSPSAVYYFNTTTKHFRNCVTTNTWEDMAGSGGSGMAIGGSVASGTTGSVPFFAAGPVLSQNNTRLYWDSSAPFGQLKLFDKTFTSSLPSTEWTHFSVGSNSSYTAPQRGGFGLNMWFQPVFPNGTVQPYFAGQRVEVRTRNDGADTSSMTAIAGLVNSIEETATASRPGKVDMSAVVGSTFVGGNNIGTHIGVDSLLWFGGMSGATYGTSTNYGIRSQVIAVHNGNNPSDMYAGYFKVAGAGGGGTGNLTGTAIGAQIVMDQTPTLTRFSNVYGLRFSGWGASSSAGTTSGAVIYADASTGTTCDGTCYFIQSLNTKPSIFSGSVSGVVNPYNATTWNGSVKFTTEDDVRDKIETLQPAIQFKDEGVNIGTSGAATAVDCTGSALVCTYSSGTVTIASSGAGGMTVGNSVSGGGVNRVLYEDGSQNLAADADFNYDGTTNKLIIGTGGVGNGTLATANIVGPVSTSGRALSISGGTGTSGGSGGQLSLQGGNGSGAAGNTGGRTIIQGGTGDTGDGTGGNVEIYGGSAGASNGNGGDIGFQAGSKTGSGTKGKIWFIDPSSSTKSFFDFSNIATSSKTFTFPNATGTLALVGGSDTQVQYNNAGALAGSGSFTWANATNQLGITATGSNIPLKITGDPATGFPQLIEFRNQVYANSAYMLFGSGVLYLESGAGGAGSSEGVRFTNSSGAVQPVTIYTGVQLGATNGAVDITQPDATSKSLVIHQSASPTANAIEVQPNGSTTPIYNITPAGYPQFPGQLRVTGNVTNATTTLANATGLVTAANLTAGRTYSFSGRLYVADSVAAEGIKIAFDQGTATITDFRAHTIITDSALKTSLQTTALATTITAATITGDSLVEVSGTITVNVAGTFGIRFAQNSHATGTATLYRGSYLILQDMP